MVSQIIEFLFCKKNESIWFFGWDIINFEVRTNGIGQYHSTRNFVFNYFLTLLGFEDVFLDGFPNYLIFKLDFMMMMKKLSPWVINNCFQNACMYNPVHVYTCTPTRYTGLYRGHACQGL